jgi:hypothetical protein
MVKYIGYQKGVKIFHCKNRCVLPIFGLENSIFLHGVFNGPSRVFAGFSVSRAHKFIRGMGARQFVGYRNYQEGDI